MQSQGVLTVVSTLSAGFENRLSENLSKILYLESSEATYFGFFLTLSAKQFLSISSILMSRPFDFKNRYHLLTVAGSRGMMDYAVKLVHKSSSR